MKLVCLTLNQMAVGPDCLLLWLAETNLQAPHPTLHSTHQEQVGWLAETPARAAHGRQRANPGEPGARPRQRTKGATQGTLTQTPHTVLEKN